MTTCRFRGGLQLLKCPAKATISSIHHNEKNSYCKYHYELLIKEKEEVENNIELFFNDINAYDYYISHKIDEFNKIKKDLDLKSIINQKRIFAKISFNLTSEYVNDKEYLWNKRKFTEPLYIKHINNHNYLTYQYVEGLQKKYADIIDSIELELTKIKETLINEEYKLISQLNTKKTFEENFEKNRLFFKKAMEILNNPKEIVYFLDSNQSITKIGTTSTGTYDRLSGLQSASPYVQTLVGIKSGGQNDEQMLHNLFSDYNIHHEYFSFKGIERFIKEHTINIFNDNKIGNEKIHYLLNELSLNYFT